MIKILRMLPITALAVMMATTTASNAQTMTTFNDIQTSFAQQDIMALSQKGIIKGYPDGSFRPNDPVTRAEYAALLIRSKSIPPSVTFEGTFRDVQRGAWFMPYVELSYRLGVTNGTSETTFTPGKDITREEMVKMTVSALGRESETARRLSYEAYSKPIYGYSDRRDISKWAVKPIAYATIKGLIKGDGGKVLPKKIATRAEVAAFLNRSVVSRPKGTMSYPVSRSGSLSYVTKKDVTATAYTYSGNLSYIGLPVREGLVAVDPAQIPLGSHLFIPGYGYGIAGDTGGKIKAARVDLYHDSYRDAINFGRKDVDVYVID